MSRSLVLLFIVIVLTGCSATGPRYSEHKSTIPALSSESSRIFFFRNSRFMSGGSDAEIYINDKKVGECADDAYFFTDTVPGHVKIKTETFGALGSHEIEKELEGGNEYYFEILVNEAYVYSMPIRLPPKTVNRRSRYSCHTPGCANALPYNPS